MKEKLRNWLGITRIEKVIGKKKNKEDSEGSYFSIFMRSFAFSEPETLFEHYESLQKEHESLKNDFEELDKKFDLLERFLKIELVKTKQDIQVYDWAETKKTEGFRKTKSYEEIKKSKETSKSKCNDEDNED